MADRIGQKLGNYRLTRLLGRGGFAEVYLGEHPVLETTVAIKVLSHTRLADGDVTQFQQEARLLASLRHPQIVRVFDFGVDEGTPYLVMDYAPNGTLRTRHPRGSQLPVSTVVGYVKQIAQALQYAHDHKVVHRDIKPENMLIGEANEILLSDFGIAVIAQSSRKESTKDMAGTIAYMAPEQIKAHPCPASDQYSLGIIVYEWLCGTRPFHGSYTEVAVKHSITPPPSLREHLPTLSPDVEWVVLTALAKQPVERFASVRAFATALEQSSQDMLATERLHPPPTSSSLSSRVLSSSDRPAESLVLTTKPPSSSNPEPALQGPLALPSPSHLPVAEKTTDKSTVSRRAVLIGTACVAALGVVGTGAFVMTHQPPSKGSSVTQPTPRTSAVTTQTPAVSSPNAFFTYTGHSAIVLMLAWSPDGKRIASSSWDETVQVWDASDGGNPFTYRGHTNKVWFVAWSPDGRRIASSSDDETVQLWNASGGSDVFKYTGHRSGVIAAIWSPDGRRIASCSRDKTAQVWNASNGSTVVTYQGHSKTVYTVTWSPDGTQVASGSLDNTVQVWNANNGSNVFTYTGHTNGVVTAVWSPDGTRIASGGEDQTVQVWNASNGSTIFTYRGHTDQVNGVVWSPNGNRIASCSVDKTVQVWNVSDGSRVITYRGHSSAVESIGWSPDGRWIASCADDETVQVWRVE